MENLSEMLLQNLKDAGCSHEMIKQFLCYEEEGQIQEQLDLLSVQRQKLLDKVHREEKKIVCLDYLVYQIEKQKTNKMKTMNEQLFNKENVFGKGEANTAYAQYFQGESYLNPLTDPEACSIFFS